MENFNYELLVDLTRKLTGVIRKETSLLKQMKITNLKDLQIEKSNIASELETQQNIIKGNATIRNSLTAQHKAPLRLIAGEFDESMQEYQHELFKAQQVNHLIIQRMMDVVKEHVERDRVYTRNGVKNASGMELARNTPAIKYNQQI